MDIKLFKKNIKFFKQKKPEIYELIKEKSKASFDIKIEGDFIKVKKPDGLYIENKQEIKKKITENIDLIIIPAYTPSSPDRKWIHDRVIEKWDNILKSKFSIEKLKEKVISSKHIPLLFLEGIGVGNVFSILENENIEIDNLLVYEPDYFNFITSLYFVDWEKVYENYSVFLIIGENLDKVKTGLVTYFQDYSPVFSLFFIKISLYQKKEKFQQILIDSVNLALKGWGYYDDEKEALEHVYENLKAGFPYIYRPLQVDNESNVIIVGSGPSLDERIDFIKENKENAIIFSCGTAIHKLYKEGIVPDFQIELERPKKRVSLFEDLPEEYRKQITLIAADVVPKELLELYKDAILFPRTDAVTQFLLNPQYYPIGIAPTVTNTATSLAMFLGLKNIYFIGVDMGYRNVNKKHASDTIYGNKIKEREVKNYIEIEDNEGNIIYTDDILFWAKNNLEHLTKNLKDRNFYNLSTGAKIEGTVYIKNIDDINISKYDKQNFYERLKKVVSNEYNKFFKPDKRDHYTKAIEVINNFQKKIEQIFKEKGIKKRYKLFKEAYDYVKNLKEENIVVYVLLGGTFKHILIKVIYLIYMSKPKDIKEATRSIGEIKEDIPNIKSYLELKNLNL